MVDDDDTDVFADEARDSVNTFSPAGRTSVHKGRRTRVVKNKASRCGVMAYFKDIECAKRGFLDLLSLFDDSIQFMEPVHVLYIGMKWGTKLPSDDGLSGQLRTFIKSNQQQLQEKGVRRVTFIVTHGKEEYPAYFTFRHSLDYNEDAIVRHIEPSYALHMQLQRLSNFDIRLMPTSNRLVHLFAAIPAGTSNANTNTIPEVYDGRRFFVRSLVRKLDSHSLYPTQSSEDDLDAHPETEFAFVEALNALEMAIAGAPHGWRENSIFLNVLVEAVVELEYIEAVIRLLARRYSDKIRRLNVAMVEFTISLKPHADSSLSTPYRFVCTNPTGYVLNVQIYEERRDPATNKIVFRATSPATTPAPWEGQEIYTPYPISSPLMKQRATAWAAETLYVYDFITLFEHALARAWHRNVQNKNAYLKDTSSAKKDESLELKHSDGIPPVYITSTELILDPSAPSNAPRLIESHRTPGINDVGMIAWKWTIYTPEYPSGRDLIVIANDITYQAGTFGTQEDLVFDLASKYARAHGLPRIYIAANSGARIGLAEELRHKFRIAWNHGDVSKGMSYIYLTPDDYQQYKDCVIAHELIVPEGDVDAGQVRWVIHDIIGRKHGLGVENLRGSGTIAGETSCAYEEIFTLTYIAGRSVGIGAYLARLGQRCIQKEPQPIILTGFNALNKLLGRTVYTSNVQLGGPDIMYTNGVSHQTVDNDMQGVQAILRWLSYVPAKRHQSFALTATKNCDDPIERRIEFRPTKNAYDPRYLCAGVIDPTTQKWTSGFFDRDSFVEILGGWARSVVVGRARLGGIPMGVIVVETRTVEQIRPADPANPESKEQVSQRAGQVWYPDSAFKTAQGIRDMIAEDLPLIIFANWRGFSGGMQDMFDEVLKFGSYIVDALRAYRHPVFVYIPPHGTLRGGAWVVVDSTINEQYMEMYADESGRAGVLETEGTLDVKFRKKDILVMCHRLDPQLIALDAELASVTGESKTSSSITPSTRTVAQIRADIAARERLIFPLYHQTAAHFADLHDTPGRMQAKGCIHGMIRWEDARAFFYHRLLRRQAELDLIPRIQEADPSYAGEEGWRRAKELIAEWVSKDVSSTYASGLLSNDQLLVGWFESKHDLIEQQLSSLRGTYIQQHLRNMITELPNKELVSGMSEFISGVLLDRLTIEQKAAFKKLFN